MLIHPCRTLRKHDSVCRRQTCFPTCSLLLTQSLQFGNTRQIFSPHITMMCRRMMLSEIIRQIRLTRPPINLKLALLLSIQQPFESHIHRFSSFWSDSRVYYSFRCRIICLNRRAACVAVDVPFLVTFIASFAFINKAPNSASAADDITCFIICAMLRIAPLLGEICHRSTGRSVRLLCCGLPAR